MRKNREASGFDVSRVRNEHLIVKQAAALAHHTKHVTHVKINILARYILLRNIN